MMRSSLSPGAGMAGAERDWPVIQHCSRLGRMIERMECRRIRELLPLLAGGELEGSLFKEARQHVATCERCREELMEFGHQSLMLKALPASGGSDSIWESVREKIDQRAMGSQPPTGS